jgi:hypothetical protein
MRRVSFYQGNSAQNMLFQGGSMPLVDPEIHHPQPEAPLTGVDTTAHAPETAAPSLGERIICGLNWTFIGSLGLRAGWSALIFFILLGLFGAAIGFIFVHLHLVDFRKMDHITAPLAFFNELIAFLALVGAAAAMALIERRRSLLAYNLTGPRRIPHFLSGLAAGFVALSALVGVMAWKS